MFLLFRETLIPFLVSIPFAVMDLRFQKIRAGWFSACFLLSLLYGFLSGRTAKSLILSLIPGGLMYLLSEVSRGGIGKGDAFFFLAMFGFLPPGKLFSLVGISWGLAAAAAFFCFFSGKRKPLPFLSFVPLSFVMMAILEMKI